MQKIRFGEIMEGMDTRISYAFDREAYSRFLPIAKANEIKICYFLKEPATGLDSN